MTPDPNGPWIGRHDPAEVLADSEQVDGSLPQVLPLGAGGQVGRAVRADAGEEQEFRAVDVADPSDGGLVE